VLANVTNRPLWDWDFVLAECESGFLCGTGVRGLDRRSRRTIQSIVRAQLTRIYSKAGVLGRARFAAFSVKDLLGAGVPAQLG
jgi:hypothetical protein